MPLLTRVFTRVSKSSSWASLSLNIKWDCDYTLNLQIKNYKSFYIPFPEVILGTSNSLSFDWIDICFIAQLIFEQAI